MKTILLIGLGRFGRHLAKELSSLGHEIMAIDKNESRVDNILQYATKAQIGDSTNVEFLKTLDIPSYDMCYIAIAKDFQSSLETTSLLKELGAKFVISQAERDIQSKFLLRNGADEVIYPEQQVAKWAAIRYSSHHILDYVELDGENGLYEVHTPAHWLGETIGDLDIRKKYHINIIGIKENGKIRMSINSETRLLEGYSLLVLGDYKSVQKCFRL